MLRTISLHFLSVCLLCITSCTERHFDSDERLRNNEPSTTQDISFLDINAFAQDSLGYMWIATLGGLNRYNGYDFQLYTHQANDTTSLNNDFVFSVFIDSSNNLWVGTAVGLDRFDFETEKFEKYQSKYSTAIYSFFEASDGKVWVATPFGLGWINKKEHSVVFPFKQQPVNLLWEDKANHLWVGLNGDKGLAMIKDYRTWIYYPLPQQRKVTCCYADPQGRWWLGTNQGIIIFNPGTRTVDAQALPELQAPDLCNTQITFIKEIEPLRILIGTTTKGFFYYDIVSHSLLQNMPLRFNPNLSLQLHTCYKDRQDNIWIGTYDKGFVIGNKYGSNFNKDQVLSDLFKGKFITRVIEDRWKNLWIATRYDGLFRYSSSKETMKYPEFKDYGFFEELYIDSKNRLWMAFENTLLVGSITSGGMLQIQKRFNIENVRVIKEDHLGNIWLGTWSGLFKIKPDMGSFEKIFSANVPDICILKSGNLLFTAYSKGIYKIDNHSSKPMQVKVPAQFSTLVLNCITVYQDSQGRIWIGTYGNGSLCMQNGKYSILSTENGLLSNNTLCFKEDADGRMWISTSRGVARVTLTNQGFDIKHYLKGDGTLGDQFHEKAGCRTSDGRIFFAGNHGLTFFSPLDIRINKTSPQINIEDLRIFNRSVTPGQKGTPLEKDILYTKKMILNYKQTTISLDYAGIDFTAPNKLTYKYKLEGFEKQWNYVGTYRRASYSNLPPGKYTFLVSAINSDGIESIKPASIAIVVKAAPWLTWQAWLLYSLCGIALVTLILKTWIKTKLNEQLIETEHNERKREKQVAQMKMNFFANISHEIRTPLTLISAPLDQILSHATDPDNTILLNNIARNVKRMWQLTNQLLDFGKIENGVLRLNVAKTNAIEQIKNIYDSFSYLAERKNINLQYVPHCPEELIWLDEDKLEKILYNLLTNAIKHTTHDKSVYLTTRIISQDEARELYETDRPMESIAFMETMVSDQGEGILSEKMKELFVRYQQIETEAGVKPDYSGNGIGLNYTKTLVETHKGFIRAAQNKDGGMDFAFILPTDDVYSEKEKKQHTEDLFIMPQEIKGEGGTLSIDKQSMRREEAYYTILVAEDNIELLDYLENLFAGKYCVIRASNGKEAWECIQSQTPDLVVSDVIMPEWNGYELCSRIKADFSYCHIPVILLTARTIVSEQVEGLNNGADAYICKPFNNDFLLLTIRNMLKHKEDLQKFFCIPQMTKTEVWEIANDSHEKIFMEKLTGFLEKELDNPELNIDFIAQELGYSRSVFYRKIKSMTNTPPNDFIRIYRLKRAAEKIVLGTDSLTEIAERTGFSSYSYFSKVFKKHFGISPKKYHGEVTLEM